jgi:hypothetical protein
MESPATVDLMGASAQLGMSRERVLRMVLTRRLSGQRDQNGRWRVLLADVKRLERELESHTKVAP